MLKMLKWTKAIYWVIFASLPPFIIFRLFQRYIMGGINIGGVKG